MVIPDGFCIIVWQASRCPTCWTEGYYTGFPEEVDLDTFDNDVADVAVRWLRSYSARPRLPSSLRAARDAAGNVSATRMPPFFLMAGFHAGHKPWTLEPSVHESYGAAGYTLAESDIRLWHRPAGTGPFTSPVETRLRLRTRPPQWDDYPTGQASVQRFEAMRRGYLVNERRWDDAFARVLRELQLMGVWEQTVVVFHGDHGLSLGEYGVWGKGKLLDIDTQA